MDETAFDRAAADPSFRGHLHAALQADPALRAKAQAELQRLTDGQAIGMILDRCHISRTKHELLTRMLATLGATDGAKVV